MGVKRGSQLQLIQLVHYCMFSVISVSDVLGILSDLSSFACAVVESDVALQMVQFSCTAYCLRCLDVSSRYHPWSHFHSISVH